MIQDILSKDIRDFCQSNEVCARITDIKFDINQVKAEVLNICNQYPPISKDHLSKYKALGLQYVDELDQYYDCVESTRYINENHVSKIETKPFSDWYKWNHFGKELYYLAKPIYDLNLKLYRTRILLAETNFKSVTHIDYDWRYHIPIQTNEDCILSYDDLNINIHMPADGHAYLLNAGFMHYYINHGKTNRYHYCGILSLPCEGDGLFEQSLKNGNKERLKYVYTL